MPALDWPEDDAASEAAATWTFPDWLTPTETARHHASRDQAAHDHVVSDQSTDATARDLASRDHAVYGQAPRGLEVRAQAVRGQEVRAHTVPGQVARGQAPRAAAAPTPLRLTSRGRIVVAVAAALLVTLLSLLITGGAWATSHSAPSRGGDQNLTQVVVQPGQSLWSVAQTADLNADPRQVMQQIIELNGLAGDVVQAGQQLWVPRG